MRHGGDFKDFLAAARGTRAPSEDDAARIEQKLEGKLTWKRALPPAAAAAMRSASAAMKAPAPATPEPVGRTSTPFGSSPWFKLLGLTAVIVVAGATIYTATGRTPAPAPAVGAVSTPQASPPPSPIRESSAKHGADAGTMLVVGDPSELPTVSAPNRRPTPAAPAHTPNTMPASSLDAELALLAETSSALRKHDPARALGLTSEHSRRFPAGVLRPEFAAQRVLALSALGRKTEACSEARAFVSRNPSSPLLPQVRTACDEIDPRP